MVADGGLRPVNRGWEIACTEFTVGGGRDERDDPQPNGIGQRSQRSRQSVGLVLGQWRPRHATELRVRVASLCDLHEVILTYVDSFR